MFICFTVPDCQAVEVYEDLIAKGAFKFPVEFIDARSEGKYRIEDFGVGPGVIVNTGTGKPVPASDLV